MFASRIRGFYGGYCRTCFEPLGKSFCGRAGLSKRPDKACESLGAISDMRDAGCGEKAAPEASASAADAPHSTRYKSSLAGQSAYERRAQALARRGLDEEDMHFIGAMASHSPPWKTPPPETGLAGIADVAVTKAIREGAFDNLAGMGKPLKQGDDHSFQFYTVDPTMQAVNRILKENNFKTASLELRDDLCYAEAQLFELVTKCLTPSCGHTDVRGNREVSLKLQEVNFLIRKFNTAVLHDRETFGASWPLSLRAELSYDEVVAKARTDNK